MRVPALASLLCAAALGAAPAAHGADLRVDRGCYAAGQEAVLSGSGYAPGATVTITENGRAKGTLTADDAGAFVGAFEAPPLRGRERQAGYALSASDGSLSARTSYRVTKVFAGFAPSSGDPRTLRVRYALYGFGLGRATPVVYLHYVRPDGRHARTVRLGRARTPCGSIGRTALRRLFAFAPSRGRWILQFDTNRRYRRATQRSDFVWVRKPVRVTRDAR